MLQLVPSESVVVWKNILHHSISFDTELSILQDEKTVAALWETCILFCKQGQASIAISFIPAVTFWAALGLNVINLFSNQDFF